MVVAVSIRTNTATNHMTRSTAFGRRRTGSWPGRDLRELFLQAIEQPGQVTRNAVFAFADRAGLGNEKSPLGSHEVCRAVEFLHVWGARDRGQFDLDCPKSAAKIEQQIDLMAVVCAEEVRLKRAIALFQGAYDLFDDEALSSSSLFARFP